MDVNTLKHRAYELVKVKDRMTLDSRYKAVNGWMGGKLRYAMAISWCRCPDEMMNTARYYYCVGMSAQLGFTAYDFFGCSIVSKQSITEENQMYQKLIKLTRQTSMFDMAVVSARNVIRLVYLLRPYWFEPKWNNRKDND